MQHCTNATLFSPVLKPAGGGGVQGVASVQCSVAIIALKTEEEGLLELQCLKKQVAL